MRHDVLSNSQLAVSMLSERHRFGGSMSDERIRQILAEIGTDAQEQPLSPTFAQARTATEMLALLAGETLDDHRAGAALRAELDERAKQYVSTSANEWPEMEFQWDLAPSSARRSLDGCSVEEFARSYPHGVKYGWVSLRDLDQVLCRASQVSVAEQWQVRDPGKLAHAIVYIAGGNPISPPLIAPVKGATPSQVYLVGGNHRYAVALAKNLPQIPVCFDPVHEVTLRQLLQIHESRS